MAAFWVILCGILVATSCALLGSFLMLRKMSLVGDAISHAVLPGIVIAYLITGSRDNIFMVLGASFFGILITILIAWLHKKGKMQEDAAIGVAFTGLFALGILLITRYTAQVDLDQDCVLFGLIELAGFDFTQTGTFLDSLPRPVWQLLGLLAMNILLVVLGYKGWLVSSFDSVYAQAIGVSIATWHYVLMSAVSVTTVIAFESVGAILVIALMVAPPATAFLLTGNLQRMLWLSVAIGIVAAVAGFYLASALNASVSGAIATVLGVLFVVVLPFSQRLRRGRSSLATWNPSQNGE